MIRLFLILFCLAGMTQAQNLKKAINLNTLTKEQKKGYKIKTDRFNDMTTITYKYGVNHGVHAYIVVTDGFAALRMVVKYGGRDWVFFDRVNFLIDGERVEYVPKSTETEMRGTTVYEESRETVNSEMRNLLEKLVNSEKAEYQLAGKRAVERPIPQNYKENILKILEFYDLITQN